MIVYSRSVILRTLAHRFLKNDKNRPRAVEVPERLAILAHREKVAIPMGTDKAAFREWLLKM